MTDIIRTLKVSWLGSPWFGSRKMDPGIRESIERAEAEAEAREMAWISGAIAATEACGPRWKRGLTNTQRD